MQKPPRFLKFSPLYSKKRSSGPSLYTGVPLWPASDAYYQRLKRPAVISKSPAQVAQATTRSNVSSVVKAAVSPVELDVGDAVEVVSRNGHAKFGLVSWAPVGPYFDLLCMDGHRSSHAVNNVSVALKSWMEPAVHVEPSVVVPALQGLVANAKTLSSQLRSHLRVVYAQSALMKRPRAVDFEDVCRRVWALYCRRSIKHSGEPESLPPSLSAEIQLATYMALAYHDLGFVRWRRGPFVAASYSTMDSVNKVMYALTQEELEYGGAQMRADPGLTAGIGSQLRAFLEHYAVWSDARLGRAAEAILTQVYPDRGDADASVALSDRLLADTPLLHLFTQEDGLKAELVPKTASPSKSELEDSRAWSLSDDIAISVAAGDDGGWNFALYIPYVPIKSILGVRGLGNRARSIAAGAYRKIPLVEPELREALCFSSERSVSAVAVRIPTDRNYQWNENNVEIGLVSCSTRSAKPFYFDKNSDAEFQEDHERSLRAIESFLATAPETIPAYELLGGTEAVVRANLIAGQLARAYAKKRRLEIPGKGGVGRPFDNSLALITQRQLLKPRSLTAQEPLESHIRRSILPNWWLADLVEERLARYEVLSGLQEELRSSSAFHMFRCVILQPANYPGLATAWCRDIDLQVEVSVLPHTRLYEGDQIICTEILELDPIQGLIVLNM